MDLTIEAVVIYEAWRRKVNRCDLKDIVFFKDGKKVGVSDEAIKRWKFTGLSNIDFVLAELDLEESND